jgi:hypothetical protein
VAELEEPHDLSIALSDAGAFVALLRAPSGKAGTRGGEPARRRKRRFRYPLIPWGWPKETILQVGIGHCWR